MSVDSWVECGEEIECLSKDDGEEEEVCNCCDVKLREYGNTFKEGAGVEYLYLASVIRVIATKAGRRCHTLNPASSRCPLSWLSYRHRPLCALSPHKQGTNSGLLMTVKLRFAA